jgi:hypothetical protein
VFLSYRRTNEWLRFVTRHFLPKFKHWLDNHLGRSCSIFFDGRDIETGASWPHRLASGVAHSRIMVCLWSSEYFSSDWCSAELAQMLERRRSLAGSSGPLPLILAVVMHDCEDLDPRLGDIQVFDLKDYCNHWIADGSPMAERLAAEIEKFARDVARALQQAPEHDPAWENLATDEFVRIYRKATQGIPPSLGTGIT